MKTNAKGKNRWMQAGVALLWAGLVVGLVIPAEAASKDRRGDRRGGGNSRNPAVQQLKVQQQAQRQATQNTIALQRQAQEQAKNNLRAVQENQQRGQQAVIEQQQRLQRQAQENLRAAQERQLSLYANNPNRELIERNLQAAHAAQQRNLDAVIQAQQQAQRQAAVNLETAQRVQKQAVNNVIDNQRLLQRQAVKNLDTVYEIQKESLRAELGHDRRGPVGRYERGDRDDGRRDGGDERRDDGHNWDRGDGRRDHDEDHRDDGHSRRDRDGGRDHRYDRPVRVYQPRVVVVPAPRPVIIHREVNVIHEINVIEQPVIEEHVIYEPEPVSSGVRYYEPDEDEAVRIEEIDYDEQEEAGGESRVVYVKSPSKVMEVSINYHSGGAEYPGSYRPWWCRWMSPYAYHRSQYYWKCVRDAWVEVYWIGSPWRAFWM